MKYKQYGRKSGIIQRVAIGVIILGMIGVAGYVAWRIYNMPEYAVDREIHKIAEDYYENYYYDHYVAEVEAGKLKEELSERSEKGLQPTRLRQLLSYDDGKYENSREIFEAYRCNTNQSKVTYYPQEPYGRADYTYEISLACKGS